MTAPAAPVTRTFVPATLDTSAFAAIEPLFVALEERPIRSAAELERWLLEASELAAVLSEVGAKEAGILIAPARWIEMMETELAAGAIKVIAEARESGTVGIYRPSGKAHTVLINMILSKINIDQILWEAPLKSQQAWFINHFGANVNLGNIAPNDIIPLETLRLGLRGDTFFRFLPDEYKKYKLE